MSDTMAFNTVLALTIVFGTVLSVVTFGWSVLSGVTFGSGDICDFFGLFDVMLVV